MLEYNIAQARMRSVVICLSYIPLLAHFHVYAYVIFVSSDKFMQVQETPCSIVQLGEPPAFLLTWHSLVQAAREHPGSSLLPKPARNAKN